MSGRSSSVGSASLLQCCLHVVTFVVSVETMLFESGGVVASVRSQGQVGRLDHRVLQDLMVNLCLSDHDNLLFAILPPDS